MGMNEIWKDIEGYEDLYQISNMGRVKSLERNLLVKNGHYRKKNEAIMRQTSGPNGYHAICLRLNKKTKRFLVHRLVGIAFIPNPLRKETINHKDGVKNNNRLFNLEWATQAENLNHALITGLRRSRERSLKDIEALTVITFLSTHKRVMKKLARHYMVSPSLISRIKKRETWSHMPFPTSTEWKPCSH